MSEHKMEYVRLGKSGLKVSKIILGCMSYGDPIAQSWMLGEEEGIKHIKYAYEQGINTFDTANTYSAGESEVILGKALKAINAPRESVVILTKVYFPVDRSGETINKQGLSRKVRFRDAADQHIFDSIQASLKRLQLDYVDVLQCHRFDTETPIEETVRISDHADQMQALHDVVQKGWVRYVGMSSCFAYQFQAMQNYAITNRLTPFISMQNFHNASYREEEREMIPTLKMFGVGMIPWSPLNRGFLARPWKAEETERVKTDKAYKARGTHLPSEATQKVNERVEEIAKKKGISMAQVALAWSLSNEFVTAPIIGSTKLDRLQELIDGIHVKLTKDEVDYISEPYEPRAIVGHT